MTVIDHRHVDASGISQTDLDTARALDIFFNHQSVGANILAGIDDLAADNPTRYAVTRQSGREANWYHTNNGIGDYTLGSNGDPQSKVDGFVNDIDTLDYASHVRVALMKFCYSDISPSTAYTGQQVWDMYRPAMEALISSFPSVYFVWTTAPLRTSGNQERHAFNVLVRDYINTNGGWLFDIADIEAYDTNGDPHTDGGYPALVDAYTTDGGHLNDAGNVGRDRAANAWWWLMSGLVSWTTETVTNTDTSSSNTSDGVTTTTYVRTTFTLTTYVDYP